MTRKAARGVPRGALLLFPEERHDEIVAARRALNQCEECGWENGCPFGRFPTRCKEHPAAARNPAPSPPVRVDGRQGRAADRPEMR